VHAWAIWSPIGPRRRARAAAHARWSSKGRPVSRIRSAWRAMLAAARRSQISRTSSSGESAIRRCCARGSRIATAFRRGAFVRSPATTKRFPRARSRALVAMSSSAARSGSEAITHVVCGPGAARGVERFSAATIAGSRVRCRGRKRRGSVCRSRPRSRATSSRRSAVLPRTTRRSTTCSRGTRAVPPATHDAAPDRIVESPRGRLIKKLRIYKAAVADVLVPAVSAIARPALPAGAASPDGDAESIERRGDRVLVAGYSTFDAVSAPPSVFALLARLDGATPWRTALAELADPALDEALVLELRRAGALRDPAGSDDPPESE
jgi:hypothetical protein